MKLILQYLRFSLLSYNETCSCFYLSIFACICIFEPFNLKLIKAPFLFRLCFYTQFSQVRITCGEPIIRKKLHGKLNKLSLTCTRVD